MQTFKFAEPEGIALYLDAYQPSGTGPFPTIIAIHGGGFDGGTRTWMQGICNDLVARGYVAIAPDYREPGQYPEHIEDCKTAVQWVRANAQMLKVKPHNIGSFGTSAGGRLAVELARLGRGDQGAQVAAAVGWSGAYDLTRSTGDPVRDEDVARDYFGYYPVPEEIVREASPALNVAPGFAPTFLAHATGDALVPYEQSVIMRDALVAVGIPTGLFTHTGTEHGTKLRNVGAGGPSLTFINTHVKAY